MVDPDKYFQSNNRWLWRCIDSELHGGDWVPGPCCEYVCTLDEYLGVETDAPRWADEVVAAAIRGELTND